MYLKTLAIHINNLGVHLRPADPGFSNTFVNAVYLFITHSSYPV